MKRGSTGHSACPLNFLCARPRGEEIEFSSNFTLRTTFALGLRVGMYAPSKGLWVEQPNLWGPSDVSLPHPPLHTPKPG